MSEAERKLKIGLPKGSLQEPTVALFRKAGFPVTVDERAYSPDLGDDELWGVLLRAQELPVYIAHGALDCGLTGYDWILERGVDLVEVCDLIYAKKGMRPYKWVLAVHENSGMESVKDLQGKRIATELVEVTKKYLAQHGVEAEVEFSWGATEVKVPEMVDAIVELTETGLSLAANDLRVLDTVMDTNTKFVANKKAWEDSWKRQKIEALSVLLQGALMGQANVGLKMNVARADVDKVLKLLPALRQPTISALTNEAWVAVETVLDEREARELIPELRRAGAEGIVEYPLNKVIP